MYKKYPDALRYIEDISESLCMEAIQHHPSAIKYVKYPTAQIFRYILRRNPYVLRKIDRNSLMYKVKIADPTLALSYMVAISLW